jgi:hypothetical protein
VADPDPTPEIFVRRSGQSNHEPRFAIQIDRRERGVHQQSGLLRALALLSILTIPSRRRNDVTGESQYCQIWVVQGLNISTACCGLARVRVEKAELFPRPWPVNIVAHLRPLFIGTGFI